METAIDTLCIGCPLEFQHYFRYVRQLHFDEAPDYTFLRNLFRRHYERLNFQYDYQFDCECPSLSASHSGRGTSINWLHFRGDQEAAGGWESGQQHVLAPDGASGED